MRKQTRWSLSLPLALGAAAAVALGHGAAVPPKVPPYMGGTPYDPGSGSGGPAGGDAPQPGGGSSTTPGGGPDPAPPGGPAPGPKPNPGSFGPVTPPPGARANTGAGGSAKKLGLAESPDRWDLWWKRNRSRYLGAARQSALQTGAGAGFATGRGSRATVEASVVLPRDLAERSIVPALLQQLSDSDPEVLDSATFALAKVAAGPSREQAILAIRPFLASPHASVRQSVLLGLGVLGDRTAARTLFSAFTDGESGRRALGAGGELYALDRALAAFALGLAGGPDVAALLRRTLERSSGEDVEVQAAAVAALGLIEEDCEDSVVLLVQLVRDEKVDRRVRAQAALALGRLGERAAPALPELLARLASGKTDLDVRRSAAIAVGRLADPLDEAAIGDLRAAARRDKDSLVRRFALMALAAVAERGYAAGGDAAAAATEIARQLGIEVDAPANAEDRAFAILGAAIAGRAARAAGAPSALGADLLAELRATGNPSLQGALAIGLGLLREHAAGEFLHRRFLECDDAVLRGHLAVACGMMGYTAASDDLRAALRVETDPQLCAEIALGASELGDSRIAGDLVERLAKVKTFSMGACLGRALGETRVTEATLALADLVRDRSTPATVRAFGCVALGMMAEQSERRWKSELEQDSNYALAHAAQELVLDIH